MQSPLCVHSRSQHTASVSQYIKSGRELFVTAPNRWRVKRIVSIIYKEFPVFMQDLSLEKQSEQTPQSMLRRAKRPPRVWQWIALALVAGLSAFLNFYALAQNGYGNQFYSSAVKSMQMNWHTFFFVSFDPAGFIAVDKPPVDLWLQTLSVKLFGFSGPSLLFPQALAGVLAVLVLFHLVRRSFGFGAGLLSALMMATTPIAVVISRNNNLDMMLVLVMLLATWAVMIAAETGHLRWLILGAILVGLGFNVKMLEAYLVVPALGLLYLLTAPRTWSIRLLHLLPAILLLLVVSLAWIEAVDLTPAANRPFVGSTRTNSEFDLAVGYNGIGRLVHLPNPAPTPDPSRATPAGSHSPLVVVASLASSRKPPTARITGISTKHSPAGGSRETGTPGPLRLLQLPLGGQIGWLIPLAFFGMLALLVQNCWRWLRDGERRGLILWGMWFLTTLIFFNIAVSIHGYYTVMMAAPISALAGIGLVTLWQAYRTRPFRDWRGWLLPLALLTEALFQTTLLVSYPGWKCLDDTADPGPGYPRRAAADPGTSPCALVAPLTTDGFFPGTDRCPAGPAGNATRSHHLVPGFTDLHDRRSLTSRRPPPAHARGLADPDGGNQTNRCRSTDQHATKAAALPART